MDTDQVRNFSLHSVVWEDPRAVDLRQAMDVEMAAVYNNALARTPAQMQLVRAALTVDPADVHTTLLALDEDGTPLAHAALRLLAGDWEVKRVIVVQEARGRGIGRALMSALEDAARAAGAVRLILQTGDRQPAAVRLYEGLGFTPIPTYEPYIEAIPTSMCFEKKLI